MTHIEYFTKQLSKARLNLSRARTLDEGQGILAKIAHFEAAIKALQEREERSKPTKAWIKYSYDEWICPYCGYDKYCDTLDRGVLPPFCEECGRPLKGADND